MHMELSAAASQKEVNFINSNSNVLKASLLSANTLKNPNANVLHNTSHSSQFSQQKSSSNNQASLQSNNQATLQSKFTTHNQSLLKNLPSSQTQASLSDNLIPSLDFIDHADHLTKNKQTNQVSMRTHKSKSLTPQRQKNLNSVPSRFKTSGSRKKFGGRGRAKGKKRTPHERFIISARVNIHTPMNQVFL